MSTNSKSDQVLRYELELFRAMLEEEREAHMETRRQLRDAHRLTAAIVYAIGGEVKVSHAGLHLAPDIELIRCDLDFQRMVMFKAERMRRG